MPTLSVVKFEFLTIAKWVGLVLGILFGILVLIRGAVLIREIVSPTPPTPPAVGYGKLPAISFQEGIKKNFTFKIETLNGDLPVFSDRTNVYKMDTNHPNILAVERTSQKASSLGFDRKAKQLSDRVYKWTSLGPPSKTLVINVFLSEFTLSSAFLTDQSVLSGTNLPKKDKAIDIAKEFLNILSLYPDDIDEERTKTDLLRIDEGVITQASSFSDTQLISVHFFQKARDKMPVVYPSGTGSTMTLTVGGGTSDPQVIDARYFYQKISNQSSNYPIKTPEEAFEELKKGNVYIASFEGQNLNIEIKKVYLGFYSEGKTQNYLMPVVVFEGDHNFMGYVSAVKDEWISN